MTGEGAIGAEGALCEEPGELMRRLVAWLFCLPLRLPGFPGFPGWL